MIDINVSFICQECFKPLSDYFQIEIVDETYIKKMNDILHDHFNRLKSDIIINDDNIEDINQQDNSENFHNIASSDLLNIQNSYQDLVRIFKILTDTTGIDHPLCSSCLENTINKLNAQIKIHEDEALNYEPMNYTKTSNTHNKLIDKFVCCEISEIQDHYALLKNQFDIMRNKLENEELKFDEIVNLRNDIIHEINIDKYHIDKLSDSRLAIAQKIKHLKNNTNYLLNTHAIEMSFDIREYEPGLAMINGCRLGKSRTSIFNWQEVNIGLGYICHLTKSISILCGLNFVRYDLHPLGEQSCVISLSNNIEFPMFDMGNFRFFWDTKFEEAMKGYMDCFSQIGQFMVNEQNVYKFPYDIIGENIYEDRDHMSGYSPKFIRKDVEIFTRAMFLIACNLKIVMAWLKDFQEQ